MQLHVKLIPKFVITLSVSLGLGRTYTIILNNLYMHKRSFARTRPLCYSWSLVSATASLQV